MKDFKSVWDTTCRHAKILWKGFLRMICGAMTAGLFALAVYGFVMISTENGWTAVCEFIVATSTLAVAVTSMYAMGAGRKRGARR